MITPGSGISPKQRLFILGLVCENKEFIQDMGGNTEEADYPDVMKFLQKKLPYLNLPGDINTLSMDSARILISRIKNI